jgi:protein tyrosine phosphatase (PTP) superfamily phosphohydrolase (DUF442 family)
MKTEDQGKAVTKRPRNKQRRLLIAAAAVAILITAGIAIYCKIYVVYSNFHVVVEHQVYRSARPNPARLQQWSGQYGIRTVINLEGGEGHEYFTENRTKMKELGIVEIAIKLASSRLPTSEQVHEMIDAIETCRQPMLIHCRAGAERAGLGSVIADMAIGGKDYASARGQLSPLYLHLRHGKDRAEGLVDQYEAYCSERHVGTGGWKEFRDWAMNVYGRQGA